ncbi:unnamed protein product [Rhodiola kirilowii]
MASILRASALSLATAASERRLFLDCLQASLRIENFAVRASSEEATVESGVVDEEEIEDDLDSDDVPEVIGDAEEDATDSDQAEVVEPSAPSSPVIAALQSYKEALASNDEPKISDVESFFRSFEEEKINLEAKVNTLSQELSTEKDRILRISADFENFRRRTERERLSLVENAQGEVVESLLPVLDNFERAKAQLKVESEGEEKINNSYQSIYKQFVEILNSLRVVPVDTTGTSFDPLLHEAIMREESDEFKEGIILQEFRKGFKLGDRLLRPSMVKVSAGPGPAKAAEVEKPSSEGEGTPTDTVEEDSSKESEST